MKTIKLKPYLRKGLLILASLLFVFLLIFLNVKHQEQICTSIEITIDAPVEQQLVSEQLIKKNLSDWYAGGLSGTSKSDINFNEVEQKIESMPAVKKAEISFGIDGKLDVQIKQRVPIVRIIGYTSFYLDVEGTKIPSNATNPARVPIAIGTFNSDMTKKIHTLATYVNENAFMQALVEQIFVDNNDLVIIPKIKNQKIVIGDTTDIPEKFAKLQDFYEHGLKNVGFAKYSLINLKYKGQIVCK